MAVIESSTSDLVLCGREMVVAGEQRPFIVRLSASGALKWSNVYDIGLFGNDIFLNDCQEDASTGDIYFGGQISNGAVFFGAVNSVGSPILLQSVQNAGSAVIGTMA